MVRIPGLEKGPPRPPQTYKQYIVKKGDTLRDILINKLGFTKDEASKFISNIGKKADTIYPGQIVHYMKSGHRRDIILGAKPKVKKTIKIANNPKLAELRSLPEMNKKEIAASRNMLLRNSKIDIQKK